MLGLSYLKQSSLSPVWWRRTTIAVLIMTLLLATGCRQRNRTAERLAEDSAAAQEIESNLTFNNITLEQANEQGQTLWNVRADQAIYSQDQQIAQVTNPDGELFQDGKPIFRIQASQGEVRENGETIMLRGQVVATDIKTGAVLRGDELDWNPAQGLLIIRGNLRGSHPQFQMSANEGRVLTRDRRMELSGQVVGLASNPTVRLQGERLTWNMDAETAVSDRPLRIDRLQGSQILDTATGERAEFNLKTKIATLTQNAFLNLADPPVQVSGNSLIWNLTARTVNANQPLTVVHRQQQVTLTANQGQIDLQKRIMYLTQNVRAEGQRNQSQLRSDRLTWNIPTQDFLAEGNVDYRQNNPLVTSRGPRATGKLQNQTIVLSGGRITTQIVP
ncbi:LPS export ABC transporter periplasmic protein LptC [Oscillatoria sp. FACHB-1407]|uniref:LPS export ABC transporter periplasmic protein LptC n=1 Tax=Oscillatoria sp. FACHB-1407 TaxID=2692847 RepID=UPI001683C5E0|nr:LPS export ABC transporter periplasmic protein LptC [Oscillatoria sp. FACHB-1407]MBD2465999.1 LPS export ABC transporter periplasmic protein LptC [Oscillatoria sp. FACHB-1407]